jgi:regulator of cell morphogenesis and NO signaling
MDPLNLDTSMSDWVIDEPRTLKLFEQLELEYTCGGKSLRQACLDRGLAPIYVLAILREFLAKAKA